MQIIRELGVQIYKFSISWSRILPKAPSNEVNMEAVHYYQNLINELHKYNITPMVTMYHWDLPQKLEVLGGFLNPDFVDWFKNYARVLFEWFGDSVKYWITFNEPFQICERGYGYHLLGPALNSTGVANYLCGHHLLKAHAEVYHMYKLDFTEHSGSIGIAADSRWHGPLNSSSPEDEHASETAMQFYVSKR